MNTTELLACPDGHWQVDWEVTHRIISSNVYAQSLLAFSEEVRLDEDKSVLDSLFMPDIYSIEVDWERVRQVKQQYSQHYMNELRRLALKDGGQKARDTLGQMMQGTSGLRASWSKMQKNAQRKSAANINQAVARAETGAEIARGVRDLCIDGLIIGAGVMTGGAGGALLSASSSGILKGAAKYQDTENVGSAMLTATGSFTTALIPIVGKGSAKVALIVTKSKINGMFETASALSEGKSMEQALAQGLVASVSSAGTAGLMSMLKSQSGRKLLTRFAYPVTTKIKITNTKAFAPKTMTPYLDKLTQKKELPQGIIENATGRSVKQLTETLAGKKPEKAPMLKRQAKPQSKIYFDRRLVDAAIYRMN